MKYQRKQVVYPLARLGNMTLDLSGSKFLLLVKVPLGKDDKNGGNMKDSSKVIIKVKICNLDNEKEFYICATLELTVV
jgi:hypothetical protein